MQPILSAGMIRVIKSPMDFIGGVFLLLVALAAFLQGRELTFGTLAMIGPGFMPMALATILGGLSVFLVVSSLRTAGDDAQAWSPRAPIFILGALVVFGLSLRPLGLVVAGPLVIIVSGFASSETRLFENAVFAMGMTGFCIALFKFALNLPIPTAPWWLGY